jgi:hypothetical protein
MYKDTLNFLIFMGLLGMLLLVTFMLLPPKKEHGWLAQKQMFARAQAAEILKARWIK